MNLIVTRNTTVKLRVISCLLIALSALTVCCVATAADKKKLYLSVGQIKTLDVGSVVRIAVGQDQVLTATAMDNGEIVLIPNAAGETDLVIWREGGRSSEYSITVLPRDMNSQKRIIDSILKSYPTLETRVGGDQIIIEGTVDPSAVDAINSLADSLPNTVALITPMFTKKDMISIEVTVLEIDKTYRREIGIRWGDIAEGPTLAAIGSFSPNKFFNNVGQGLNGAQNNGLDGSFIGDYLSRVPVDDSNYVSFGGIASTLTSSIQLIEENGAGRILSEPVLSARSGEQARFFAGGEVPFQVIGPLGQPTIDFFDFGVILEIAPISDGKGNILTRVNAEVSTLDNSVAVGGVPGKLTRQTESTINVLDGQTIAISGLVLVNDNVNSDEIPFLGRIPILGNLFKSKAFNERRTELIILVTPRVVDSSDKGRLDQELIDIQNDMESILGGNNILQDALER